MFYDSKIRWILIFLFAPFMLAAQKDNLIYLINPSFEDIAKHSQTPNGWNNCGFAEESAPDVQPGGFSVTKPPSHGNTYLGLVVRDNDTYESVGQRLSKPIEGGNCYEFSMDFCRAELYESLSRTTGEKVNYATPAKLRVYGGNGFCDKQELLYETSIITNVRWITHACRLQPKKTYTHIVIEAYYKTPVLFPYNGNVLLDNLSPIKQLPCNPEKMVAKPPVKKDTTRPTTTSTRGTPPAAPPKAPALPTSIERKGLKAGSIIRLDKVYFEANQFTLKAESLNALEEVFNFLHDNPDVSVEVGGHTNNNPTDDFANNLSTNRAKAVADWLIKRGIPAGRVKYKGYGKKMPIAQNTTPEGRKLNQRVEIKILSING